MNDLELKLVTINRKIDLVLAAFNVVYVCCCTHSISNHSVLNDSPPFTIGACVFCECPVWRPPCQDGTH